MNVHRLPIIFGLVVAAGIAYCFVAARHPALGLSELVGRGWAGASRAVRGAPSGVLADLAARDRDSGSPPVDRYLMALRRCDEAAHQAMLASGTALYAAASEGSTEVPSSVLQGLFRTLGDGRASRRLAVSDVAVEYPEPGQVEASYSAQVHEVASGGEHASFRRQCKVVLRPDASGVWTVVEEALPAPDWSLQCDGGYAPGVPTYRNNPTDSAQMVFVPMPSGGFFIYAQEVTVGRYRRFCRETERPEPPSPPWAIDGRQPVVNVTREDAAAYARWAGAALPTREQWQFATGHPHAPYPWGRLWPPPANRGNLAAEASAPTASDQASPVVEGVGRPGDGIAEVGSYPADVGVYGAMDMAGNVSEWVDDTRQGPDGATLGLVCGGSYAADRPEQVGVARPVASLSPTTGFRCIVPCGAPAQLRAAHSSGLSPRGAQSILEQWAAAVTAGSMEQYQACCSPHGFRGYESRPDSGRIVAVYARDQWMDRRRAIFGTWEIAVELTQEPSCSRLQGEANRYRVEAGVRYRRAARDGSGAGTDALGRKRFDFVVTRDGPRIITEWELEGA